MTTPLELEDALDKVLEGEEAVRMIREPVPASNGRYMLPATINGRSSDRRSGNSMSRDIR